MAPERRAAWKAPPPSRFVLTSIWVSIYMAGRGLNANKLRSLLTMLGVIIGVGAVIIAIGIGAGSREAVAQSIQRLGTNVLTVRPGQQRTGNINLGMGSQNTLKLEDADAVLKQCPAVQRVCPQVNGNAQVKAGNQNFNTSVNGVNQDYGPINNHLIAVGRFFSAAETAAYKRVAVLGSSAATTLFGTQSPLNQRIRVAGQSFNVVGVLQEKGGQGFRNPDDGVYIPVTTAMRRLFGLQNVQNITCQATSPDMMTEAEAEIDKVLRKRHGIPATGTADFMIFNQADLMAAQNAQQDTFSSLITWLAVVSLGVGGIGIMNIMFVSVTERTREIGVRKAIGARRNDILRQFLFEALFISAAGGILGVILGMVGSSLVGKANGWLVSVQPSTVIIAFSFSVFVGVFFGFYPAYRAANLRPIEALRYE
ncbi:MAG TPA: ABC transporter permease [Fimbriimonadaceae bacterium]|nr:ABC transporter permease [Fimbriimonadaceae bacterium]